MKSYRTLFIQPVKAKRKHPVARPDEVGLKASPTRVVKILHPRLARGGERIRLVGPDALDRAAARLRALIEEGDVS